MNAESRCREQQSHLSSIVTPEEQEFVNSECGDGRAAWRARGLLCRRSAHPGPVRLRGSGTWRGGRASPQPEFPEGRWGLWDQCSGHPRDKPATLSQPQTNAVAVAGPTGWGRWSKVHRRHAYAEALVRTLEAEGMLLGAHPPPAPPSPLPL